MYDVIIIGGGIVGCATARELSKYKLNILLLEKRAELSEGASKANSGIIHAGYDCKPKTLKAALNFEGNKMFTELSEQLDIPFRRNGSLVLAFSEDQHTQLEKQIEKGKSNGVDVQMLNRDEILNIERNINHNVTAALYAPMGGIVSPYEAVTAFAENAFINGVKFKLQEAVLDIKKVENVGYKVITDKAMYTTKVVINAAGVYSDEINNLVSENKYKIVPRKGEYLLFDKSACCIDKTIFQLPTRLGKGVLITPTVHGNMLIGPSAEDTENKDSCSTTAEAMEKVMSVASFAISNIQRSQIITSFSGLRAKLQGNDDFVIEEADDAKCFISVLGIDSPGLSAAPSIALRIAKIVTNRLQPDENKSFINRRYAIKVFSEKQNELIKSDSRYGKIVCRCETVTEGEIVDCINRPLGATTVDGVKRRTRSGMGRCQGGFCSSKVIEILSKELKIAPHEVTKFGGNSNIVLGE